MQGADCWQPPLHMLGVSTACIVWFRELDISARHEAARINVELQSSRLVTLANQDTAMCVWSEQTRGAKLARNVPVRESHTPKRRGYPRGQPMARKTNSCKRRNQWHSAKGDWECIGTSSGAGYFPTDGGENTAGLTS